MEKRTGFLVAAALVAAVVIAALAAFLVTRGDHAKLPETAATGLSPTLPEPTKTLIPTVHIAPAKGWRDGAKPAAANGLAGDAVGTGLSHPRWLYVLPNGDVLVAESDGPPRPDDAKGIKGFIYRTVQKRAGAGAPSANRITLLRDANGSGVATKTIFLEGLNSPFGMTLVGNDLYIANTDAIVRFPYTEGATRITDAGVKVADLPAGPINHHWTKNVIASRDRIAALRHRRLQQQCRRKRPGQRGKPGRDPGDRSGHRQVAGICFRTSQSQRHELGAADWRALDRGERARRTRQRSRAGLPDVGEGWRLLWVAVQLLRTACGYAGP